MKALSWLALAIAAGCGASVPPPGDASGLEITDAEPDPPDEPATKDARSLCRSAADRLSRCTRAHADAIIDGTKGKQREEAKAARQEALEGIDGMRDQCEKDLGDEDLAFVASLQKCMRLECSELFSCVREATEEAPPPSEPAPPATTPIPECDEYIASVEALKGKVSADEASKLDEVVERTRKAVAMAESEEERAQVGAACAEAKAAMENAAP